MLQYPSAYSNFVQGDGKTTGLPLQPFRPNEALPPPGPGARRPVSILLDFIFRLLWNVGIIGPCFRKT